MTDSGGGKISSTKPTEQPPPEKPALAGEKPAGSAKESYKIPQFEEPGLKNVKTTNIFRAVNFELYVKPNLFVMAVGLVSISVCVGYIAYMNATAENRKNTYTVMNEQGEFARKQKVSKWE